MTPGFVLSSRFSTRGDISLMDDLVADGTLKPPLLVSFVLGIKYGFSAAPKTLSFAVDSVPANTQWTGFSIGRNAFPMLAQAFLLGGHVRIGMEDTLFLARGELAKSNAELVSKGLWLIEQLGGEVGSAEEARKIIGLS